MLLFLVHFGLETACRLSALATAAGACYATAGAGHYLYQTAWALAGLCIGLELCYVLLVEVGNHHALKLVVAYMVLNCSEHAGCLCKIVGMVHSSPKL